jgi:hypothetical protein
MPRLLCHAFFLQFGKAAGSAPGRYEPDGEQPCNMCCAVACMAAPTVGYERLQHLFFSTHRHLDGPGEAVLCANQALRNDITQ